MAVVHTYSLLQPRAIITVLEQGRFVPRGNDPESEQHRRQTTPDTLKLEERGFCSASRSRRSVCSRFVFSHTTFPFPFWVNCALHASCARLSWLPALSYLMVDSNALAMVGPRRLRGWRRAPGLLRHYHFALYSPWLQTSFPFTLSFHVDLDFERACRTDACCCVQ